MKQHITIITNLDRESKNAEVIRNMQAREAMLSKMEEQLKIRDNLIATATDCIKSNNIEVDLSHPQLIDVEQLSKNKTLILQPITQGNSERHQISPYQPINAKSTDAIAKKYGISTPNTMNKKPLSITAGSLPPVSSTIRNQGVS